MSIFSFFSSQKYTIHTFVNSFSNRRVRIKSLNVVIKNGYANFKGDFTSISPVAVNEFYHEKQLIVQTYKRHGLRLEDLYRDIKDTSFYLNGKKSEKEFLIEDWKEEWNL